MLLSLGGALALSLLDRKPFLDSYVLSTGAVTGASFTVYDMRELSEGSQLTLWVLMAAGGISLTGVYLLLFRVASFRLRLRPLLRALKAARSLELSTAKALQAELDAAGELNESLGVVALFAGVYTAGWQALVFLGLRLALTATRDSGADPWPELQSRDIGLNWFCLFMYTSVYNNIGLSLLSASAVGLGQNTPALLVLAAGSIAGNTGWPILLRAMLWLGTLLPPCTLRRGCLYALAHPQRVYHLLFGQHETAILALALFFTNAGQMTLLRHTASVAVQSQFVPELFFAINTRSTGLVLADLNLLSPSVLILTAFCMWWSPYPLVALWAQADEGSLFSASKSSSSFPVFKKFLKMYLRRHVMWIWVAVFVLCIADAGLLRNPQPDGQPPHTSIFAYAFEVLSAYGTNGLSLGHPAAGNASLCAVMHKVSKLTLIALMMLGRHRSMPRSIDATLQARIADARAMLADARAELAARHAEAVAAGEGDGCEETPAPESAMAAGEDDEPEEDLHCEA